MLAIKNSFIVYVDNEIYGHDFLEMTRQDIAVLIPDKFVLGMKLFKIIQSYHQVSVSASTSTSTVMDEDLDVSGGSSASSLVPVKKRLRQTSSTCTEESGSTEAGSEGTKRLKTSENFSLPMFSEDVQRCMDQDAVLTTQQRNKIIRESCRALQGYCRQQCLPVSSHFKRYSAKLLSQQCPNSLGSEVNIITSYL